MHAIQMDNASTCETVPDYGELSKSLSTTFGAFTELYRLLSAYDKIKRSKLKPVALNNRATLNFQSIELFAGTAIDIFRMPALPWL